MQYWRLIFSKFQTNRLDVDLREDRIEKKNEPQTRLQMRIIDKLNIIYELITAFAMTKLYRNVRNSFAYFFAVDEEHELRGRRVVRHFVSFVMLMKTLDGDTTVQRHGRRLNK